MGPGFERGRYIGTMPPRSVEAKTGLQTDFGLELKSFINFMRRLISRPHSWFVESGVRGFQRFLVGGPWV